jgi:hypothetical protein
MRPGPPATSGKHQRTPACALRGAENEVTREQASEGFKLCLWKGEMVKGASKRGSRCTSCTRSCAPVPPTSSSAAARGLPRRAFHGPGPEAAARARRPTSPGPPGQSFGWSCDGARCFMRAECTAAAFKIACFSKETPLAGLMSLVMTSCFLLPASDMRRLCPVLTSPSWTRRHVLTSQSPLTVRPSLLES